MSATQRQQPRGIAQEREALVNWREVSLLTQYSTLTSRPQSGRRFRLLFVTVSRRDGMAANRTARQADAKGP